MILPDPVLTEVLAAMPESTAEITAQDAADLIQALSSDIATDINNFTSEYLNIRGGRIGSGMGLLLESLWGYFATKRLRETPGASSQLEIAWITSHEYNDFACIRRDADWGANDRKNELLRIEAKSMVASAAESKAHFDELVPDLGTHDLLLVLIWDWAEHPEGRRLYPKVLDFFVGNAVEVAELRDRMHLQRGGTFVDSTKCPDDCNAADCTHHGEPLNSSGTRERLGGPLKSRGKGVSFAANFGGLVRMLKSGDAEARRTFRECRAASDAAHKYISFIHRSLLREELSQYTISEWREFAKHLGLELVKKTKDENENEVIQAAILLNVPNYRDELRTYFNPSKDA